MKDFQNPAAQAANPAQIANLLYQAQTVIRLLRDSCDLHNILEAADDAQTDNDLREVNLVFACKTIDKLLEQAAEQLGIWIDTLPEKDAV